ncbi:type ISP restriction/modification enzyme [Streptomyces sp. NPDC005900]|uniref:type ISP restriction/modification enzyme n=1 Tax=unclassified Streptomyces TaxID=2593676 RepID=UPI00340078AE
MPGVTHDEAPLLADLMPWSVAPLRPGRGWPMGPDAACLKARWAALLRADGAEREALFRPTRSRTPDSAVAQLPGHPGGTGRLAREQGPCPEPVRVRHGAFDEQWLIPDHRLIDVARPELWRVAGRGQLFAVEQGYVPGSGPGPAVVASAALPDGYAPAGRPGRIRPLFRRPGGLEPNVAPGLLGHLSGMLGQEVTARSLLAWVLALGSGSAAGCRVPLTADAALWASGVRLGERLLRLQLRGEGPRPKLPGGRRPYVRAPLPARPRDLAYDAEEQVLRVGGTGVISPVPRAAWEFEVSGVRVLERWFEERADAAEAEPGTLESIRPRAWPQAWTSELLELVTVLALTAELAPERAQLAGAVGRGITAGELGGAGLLPVPDRARRPASVLDHLEEGPEGQFALL